MEVRRYESTLDNQFDTHLMSSDRRASLVSLSSTADTSSYESAPQEQDEYQRQSPPSLSTKTSMSSNDYDNWRPDSDAGSSRDGLGRSQSFTESSRAGNTRRREKAAVGFACLNCKKAHLACDVSRPCKRCIQMGRSSTCTDVPHKRRGRPRLRDTPQALPAIASVSQITLPRGETSPRQTHNTSSPLAMRRPPLHSRTGSVNSPYMDFMPPALAPAWSPRQQPRRQNQSFGLLQHSRNPSMIPGSPNPVLSPRSSPWSASPPEVFRPMSATLFVGIDLRIIRALSDVRNFFHAMPSVIEGRNLIELVMAEDRERMPQLIRALQEDVFTHKLLLFQSPEARQNLETDLLPYTDTDLAHSFPGAHEHLLSLTFIDALNRPVVSRMAAVLGSRSNDRFAYAIISIQRQEHPSAPATPRGGYSSVFSTSPRHFDPIMQSRRSPEFALRHPSVAGSVQISPTFSHRTIATSSPNMGALPRSVPEGYIPDYSYTNPTRSGISGLGLNVLPPLQNIAASEASSRTATPTQARPQTHVRDATDNPVAGAMQETLRGRGGGGDVSKRTSMSLSEMIE